MKKELVLTLLAFLVVAISCNNRTVDKKLQNNVQLSPLVDSILKQYHFKHKGKVYAVFFNKKQGSFLYRLTFAYGLNKIDPDSVMCVNRTTIFDSIDVFLFSGLEDFSLFKPSQILSADSLRARRLEWEEYLSYIRTPDTSYFAEGDTYPFAEYLLAPINNIQFKPVLSDSSLIR